MTKDRFLTARWNNRLALGLGLVVLVFVIAALATDTWSTKSEFVGMAVLGALY